MSHLGQRRSRVAADHTKVRSAVPCLKSPE